MKYAPLIVGLLFCMSASPAVSEEGDAALGARAFRACAACHSVEANRNMTGPSLADIWNRKAGSMSSFPRYSEVMKSSDVIWNEQTLDGYLENPAQFMPGNHAIQNNGDGNVQAVVSVSGSPLTPEPAAENGFKVERSYRTLAGESADPSKARQNQRFVVVLKVTEPQPQFGRVIVADR